LSLLTDENIFQLVTASASEAILRLRKPDLDCFAASLLAMTLARADRTLLAMTPHDFPATPR